MCKSLGYPQRMCLSVENPAVQTDQVRLAKNQIEVLYHFRVPKALHGIHLERRIPHNVNELRVPKLRLSPPIDRLEHVPRHVSVLRIARDAVHVEEALEGLRAED